MAQAKHPQTGNGNPLAEGHFLYRQAEIAHLPARLLHQKIVAQVGFNLALIGQDDIVLPVL